MTQHNEYALDCMRFDVVCKKPEIQVSVEVACTISPSTHEVLVPCDTYFYLADGGTFNVRRE